MRRMTVKASAAEKRARAVNGRTRRARCYPGARMLHAREQQPRRHARDTRAEARLSRPARRRSSPIAMSATGYGGRLPRVGRTPCFRDRRPGRTPALVLARVFHAKGAGVAAYVSRKGNQLVGSLVPASSASTRAPTTAASFSHSSVSSGLERPAEAPAFPPVQRPAASKGGSLELSVTWAREGPWSGVELAEKHGYSSRWG